MEFIFLIIALSGLVISIIFGFIQVVIPFIKGEVKLSKRWPFIISTSLEKIYPKTDKKKHKRRARRKSIKKIIITIVALTFLIITLIVVTKFLLFKKIATDKKIPIGVMYCDNQTGEEKYDYLRKVLASVLITDLGKSRYLQVMTIPRMYDVLKSLGYEDSEIINASMGFEICKFTGAKAMVMPSLIKSGDVFVLNAQVLDVETKELIAPPYRVTGEGEGSILRNLVDDLTDEIKKGLEISFREIEKESKDISELTTNSLEAYKFYFNGREAAFRMYNQEAIDNFEKAIALDSFFVEAYDELARQYYTINDNEKALKIIEKVKLLSSKLQEERLVIILALEAYIKHDWDLAINYNRRLIEIDPENIGAHLSLGMIYYQKKMMYDEGISEFKKVLKIDPLGITHFTSWTYNVLGWAYLRKGGFEKAHEAFKRYVNLIPNQPYPLDCLANFHLIVGNYDQAIINLKQSLEIDSEYPLTSRLLGDAYMAKGMYNKSLISYKEYLDLTEGSAQEAEAHYYLGRFHYIRGDYENAISECQYALGINPDMIEAHWIYGLALIRKEIFDKSESELLIITGLIEKINVEELKKYYYHLKAELELSKGIYQQATIDFNKAANIESLDRQFFINASGEAYFKMGELDKAVKNLESVFKINPNYVQSHYLLGLIYQKKGMKNKANEHFKRFIDIWKDADENLPQLIDARKQLGIV